VAERGLTSVKMSHMAERTGIGRPTLYKYFPDVEAILLAWHQQHVEEQLDELIRIRDRAGQPHWARIALLPMCGRRSWSRSRGA